MIRDHETTVERQVRLILLDPRKVLAADRYELPVLKSALDAATSALPGGVGCAIIGKELLPAWSES